ncbi:MAG: PAS domain S-box protein [Deltaproteobacteria bacterium]|nr:PAS domain S-box protein [Candidatus Tharpella sp.]
MTSNSQINTALTGIIDSLEISVWELDLSYRIISYNRKAREIYGEKVTGNFCYQVAAGRNNICPNCPALQVLNGEDKGRYRYQRTTESGTSIIIDHSASPLKDSDGILTGVVVSMIDITHIKTVEDELKKHQLKLEKRVDERTCKLQESEIKYRLLYEESELQKNLYHSIIHSSSDAIIIHELSGLIQYVNPAFSKMFGWTLDELKDRHVPFLPESKREGSMKQIMALIHDGTSYHAFRTKLLTKSGQLIDISLSASLYSNHKEEPAGVLVTIRDISDRVQAEKELLKARKLESVGVLAGGIAHDFNNILGAIMGNISLALTMTDENAEIHKLLKISEKASLRATDLTQQLLTFAKGGEPIKKIASIKDIIRDSADFILRGSTVKCNFNFGHNLLPVNIDSGQISQVIQNIIINAKQAMPDGGIIDIECQNFANEPQNQLYLKADNYVKITISDQGVGIPTETIDKVFDPYFTTKERGSGLGLAITHSIINKHDGRISIDSGPGQGCKITIYLAATTEKLAADPLKFPETSTKSPGSRILIMDDEEMIRDIMKSIMTLKGYEVISAADGEEAIRFYNKARQSDAPIDLIIMDLTIPGGMGGREAMQKILQLDPQAKAIVSSGYSNGPIMSDYKKYGFRAALSKPFKIQELLTTIDRALAI